MEKNYSHAINHGNVKRECENWNHGATLTVTDHCTVYIDAAKDRGERAEGLLESCREGVSVIISRTLRYVRKQVLSDRRISRSTLA